MWNCPWLLCLVVVLGLSVRRASSMNEQPDHGKNYSQTSRGNDVIALLNADSDSKRKPAKEHAEADNEEQVRPASPGVADLDLAANLTSLNTSTAPVSVSNAGKSASPHDQSHSKRHSRRSKLYRREGKVKSRGSLTKYNASSSILTLSGIERSGGLYQDHPRDPKRNSGLANLLDATSKTSITATAESNSVTASRNDSTPSTFLSTDERKILLDRLSDESFKVPKRSGSTENWFNFSSSSSSSTGSTINETVSSVELMSFGFESSEEFRRSAMTNSSHVASSSNAAIPLSSTTAGLTTQVSDLSVDTSDSTSARPSTAEMINRNQSMQKPAKRSDVDDNGFVYSVHLEKNRVVPRKTKDLLTSTRTPSDNMTQDHSVTSTSIASNSSMVEGFFNASSGTTTVRNRSDNNSTAESAKNLSHDGTGYSWGSVNDSLNRLTLLKVADTLKHIDSQEARRSYAHSNSTFSEIFGDASPKLQTESVKLSQSSLESELHPHSLKREDTEFKAADNPSALPARMSINDNDEPMKFTIPLSIETMAKVGTSDESAEENVEVSRQSKTSATTSGDPSLPEIVSKTRNADDGPLRVVLDLDEHLQSKCSTGSSTERSENVPRVNRENLVDQQRTDFVTLSVPESRISKLEHCSMRPSSSAMPHDFINDPERRLEALVASIIPGKSEEREADATSMLNRSHDDDARASRRADSSPQRRGPQNLPDSEVIVLETFEPVVSELVTLPEEVVNVDSSPVPAGLEENCNASSFNVFIPSVNSREIVARTIEDDHNSLMPKLNEPVARIETQNVTTEDSLYIMEGFGLFKNSPEDVSELEEEFNRRRDAPFDYAETEGYLVYSPPGDYAPGLKVIDEIEFKAELPVKQELLVSDVLWNRNFGEEMDDLRWLDDGTGNPIRTSTQNKDAQQEISLNPSEYPASLKDVNEVQSPVNSLLTQENVTERSTHHFYILPTIYVLIGMCVIIVGCSIWYSKKRVKRRSNLPKLKYFVQQRQETTEAIV